jgi:hypothetical protein
MKVNICRDQALFMSATAMGRMAGAGWVGWADECATWALTAAGMALALF